MLELAFRHPWKDGSRALILSPDDLLVRLCAAVPPPRVHQVRYFGVLSSHASLRPEVVSSRGHDDGAHRPPPAWGDQLELSLDEAGRGSQHGERHRWAWLLAHVYLVDVEHCPKCQGPMRWAEVAKTPLAAARLMARMGMVPEPMPRQPHPPLEQLRLPFDT